MFEVGDLVEIDKETLYGYGLGLGIIIETMQEKKEIKVFWFDVKKTCSYRTDYDSWMIKKRTC